MKERRRKKIILRGFNPSPDSSSKRFNHFPSRNFSSLPPSPIQGNKDKKQNFSFFLDRLPFKGQTVAKNIGRIPASSSSLPIYSDVTQSSFFQLNERGLIYLNYSHEKSSASNFFHPINITGDRHFSCACTFFFFSQLR